MKEERKDGNILYAIIGVTTLVVTIIGATFAYFTASVKSGEGDIKGETDDISGGLSLIVERVVFDMEDEDFVPSDALVPANMKMTAADINSAVSKKCIDNGFTGCHLYRITASSKRYIGLVSIRLSSLTVNATDNESWKYIIWKGNSDKDYTIGSDADILNKNITSFSDYAKLYGDSETGFDMHESRDLLANEPVYYYLLIYIANKDDIVQNPDSKEDPNSVSGSYSGSLSMDAMGGKLHSTFNANN